MNYKLNSKIIDEYCSLKSSLSNNKEIMNLVEQKQSIHTTLKDMDKYSSKYNTLLEEYEQISEKLLSDSDYLRFKFLERELSLFVVYCNKELEKLFELNKRKCKH